MPESLPHILVTGATRGIGAAVIQAVTDRGRQGHRPWRKATYLALDAPAPMTGAALDVNGASFVR